MAKITKTLSKKINNDTKKSEILFRFIGSSTIILRAKSGIFIDPKTWNKDKNELKSAKFGADEVAVKAQLDKLCNAILDTFTKTADKEKVDKAWLERIIDAFHFPEKYIVKDEQASELAASFTETYLKYIENWHRSGMICIARKRHFDVVVREIKRFETINKQSFTVSTFNKDTLVKFVDFLRNEHTFYAENKDLYEGLNKKQIPKPRSQNTMADKVKSLRAFFEALQEEHENYISPLKRVVKAERQSMLKEKNGEIVYLRIEELRKIHNTQVPNYLERVKDVFLLQCLIGARISDYFNLLRADIAYEGTIPYIHYQPSKTAKSTDIVLVDIPLTTEANIIIERYSDSQFLAPYYINNIFGHDGYNALIKSLLSYCKITRNIITKDGTRQPLWEVGSSKLARKTHIDILTKYQLNEYVSGHHQVGSAAVKNYTAMSISDKHKLYNVAFSMQQEGGQA